MKRFLVLAALALSVAACKHPLEIYGEGDLLSLTGNRDCLLEDYQAGATNCSENTIDINEDYDETYYAQARPGWHFHRWATYCKESTLNECPVSAGTNLLQALPNFTGRELKAIFRPDVITGFESLYMGHSLFNPFAIGMPGHAATAGFTDHNQNAFFWSSDMGAPESIWNDPVRKAQVTAVLDTGEVDMFGMTFHPNYPGMQGYLDWVDYALQQNPDTRFFIAIAWPWNPETYSSPTYQQLWDSNHTNIAHNIIDNLRAAYPYVDFFCVPYGQSAATLHTLYNDNNLPDVTGLVEETGDGVFRDSHGHADDILVDLGELVWLRAIYGVDLDTYPYNPGYTTDLKALAQSIVDSHDTNYNIP